MFYLEFACFLDVFLIEKTFQKIIINNQRKT